MKISFILSTLRLSGGVRDIVEIANRLAERGFEITFVVSGGTVAPDIREEIRPEIILLESDYRITDTALNLWQKARLAWSLFRKIPAADVIISTQTPTTVPALMGKIRRRARLAWFYQDYQEMFLDRPFEHWLARHAFRWHEAALVLSAHSKEELTANKSGPVTVVRVGLSHAEHFHPLPADKRRLARGGARNILYLGDMRPRKGLYDFLEAMEIVHREISNSHLWIVSKEECRIETDLSHEFIYRPSRERLAEMYASCDVFVSASWWESFGIPPLEAMACGAPVVMTDSRGGREYARHRENCLLVPPRDPQALARMISAVLTDPDLEGKLRVNGPKMAAEFTWEEATNRFEGGLRSLFSDG